MKEERTVARRTTTEMVAEKLRTEIQRGTLLPGIRLRQVEVAARYGVSTTPVREAFVLLQADGLIQIDPHRGAVVFRPSVDDLRESYEIRIALESLAVARAIDNLRPARLRELEELAAEMRGTTDARRWVELNDRFHMRLYSASGMDRLCALISSLRDASGAYMQMRAASHPRDKQADGEHDLILDAVRARDARAAQRLVKVHLKRAVREGEQFLGTVDDAAVAAGGGG